MIPLLPPPPFLPHPPPLLEPGQTATGYAAALRAHYKAEAERRRQRDREMEEWIAGVPRRMLLGALLAAIPSLALTVTIAALILIL